MKIVVVGAPRTRSTVLANYLHARHQDLKFYNEYYTYAIASGNQNLAGLADSLSIDSNHIVKLMSSNLLPDYTPEVFKLKEYDQIHLVERYDFFDQCCSMQVCRDTGIWNNPEAITQQQFTLTADTIAFQARNVSNYIHIKKYLLDNNIPFNLYPYYVLDQFSSKEHRGLEYKSLITNYRLKYKINALFNACFSYHDIKSELDSFITGVSEED